MWGRSSLELYRAAYDIRACGRSARSPGQRPVRARRLLAVQTRSHPGARRMATHTPAHFRGDPLLPARGRHLVGRFSYGVTPALARQVQQQGGPQAWFDRQLPPPGSRTRASTASATGGRACRVEPAELWQRQVTGTEGGWEVMVDYERWVLMRRMTLAPPAARGDDGVLGEPPQRARHRGRPLRAPRRLRRHDPRRRARPLRRPARTPRSRTRRC